MGEIKMTSLLAANSRWDAALVVLVASLELRQSLHLLGCQPTISCLLPSEEITRMSLTALSELARKKVWPSYGEEHYQQYCGQHSSAVVSKLWFSTWDKKWKYRLEVMLNLLIHLLFSSLTSPTWCDFGDQRQAECKWLFWTKWLLLLWPPYDVLQHLVQLFCSKYYQQPIWRC